MAARSRTGARRRAGAGEVLEAEETAPPGHPPRCWPLVSAETMRALDRHTIDDRGVPGDVLMESAGRAVVEALLARWPHPETEIAVVCGGGNNGGDGLVVARHLRQLGRPVRAALVGDPGRLRGEARANLDRARAAGVPLEGERWRAPGRGGVLVDAVFGTGLSRKVEGAAASVLRRLRTASEQGIPVAAVDLPSGLDADIGCAWGPVPRATLTVTLGLPKLGLAQEPGRSLAGEIRVARIGIADAAPGAAPEARLWTAAGAGGALPERPPEGHKGRFGHVLVVAASVGKTGAAALAAAGAGRGGAGLVTVACPAGLNDVLETLCTEAMTVPVADTEGRALAAPALDGVLALAAERDVVVAGPGLGRDPETLELVRGLAKRCERPLVLDADGLFAFAGEPGALRDRRGDTILTPHPGEAGRLLGRSAEAVNRDRVASARALAEASGAVVVLKGAATLVAAPGEGGKTGELWINPTGNPALASGGTGDVLAGLVGALRAQGLPAVRAAALAVYLHGAAADLLAETSGRSGLLAGDLARALPGCAEGLRRRAAAPVETPHGFLLRFPEP